MIRSPATIPATAAGETRPSGPHSRCARTVVGSASAAAAACCVAMSDGTHVPTSATVVVGVGMPMPTSSRVKKHEREDQVHGRAAEHDDDPLAARSGW